MIDKFPRTLYFYPTVFSNEYQCGSGPKHETNNITIYVKEVVNMSDFTVTDLAVQKLKEYLEQNNIDSALRIALMQGG